MPYNALEDEDTTWEEFERGERGSARKLSKQQRARGKNNRAGWREAPEEDEEFEDEERQPRPAAKRQRRNQAEEFRCRHCRMMVGLVPSGGRHRNHCPYCLHSRHVDLSRPGDRLSPCGGTMAPIGTFERADGEHTLVHRCLGCGVERHNRIAADDDFDLVLSLPDLTHWSPDQQGMIEEMGEYPA